LKEIIDCPPVTFNPGIQMHKPDPIRLDWDCGLRRSSTPVE
jgi:hypothetical protein